MVESSSNIQEKQNVNIGNVQGMLQGMQLAFQQMSSLLSAYGIEMYMYKVKLYSKESEEHKPIDEDCEDASLCFDYIVRIRCRDSYTCMKLKESIKQEGGKT